MCWEFGLLSAVGAVDAVGLGRSVLADTHDGVVVVLWDIRRLSKGGNEEYNGNLSPDDVRG